MKIEVQNTPVIIVDFPDVGQRTFSSKEALQNHLQNKVNGLQSCISYYEKEITRMKAELVPKLAQLEEVNKTEGLPSEQP